jgi:integrase
MSKKRKTRNSKGAVHLHHRGDYLELRWTYQGKAYRMSAGLNTPLNVYNTKQIISQIEWDMVTGEFDPTKEKYRPQSHDEPQETASQPTTELFEQFIEFRRQEGTSGQTIASKYAPLLSNLKRFGKSIRSEKEARAFVAQLRNRQSALIANQNLKLLKGFGNWVVEQSIWEQNPFKGIKPLKENNQTPASRKPFTVDEIRALLTTARENPKFSHYHEFCMTLLYLGLRPSEGIGLRWKHIDFERKQVTICESLSRSSEGKTAGYARQRKATKNGNERILDLNATLIAVLSEKRSPTSDPDDLVFTSPKGKPIDDHTFSQRIWKPLCAAAGVEYRVPYAARHTTISHLIDQGANFFQAAYVAGHKSTRMVIERYGHMVNRPEMPDF